MGRARKPAARKPLAQKDSNVEHHQQDRPLPAHSDATLQMMMDANHREVERHIAAIRAVRDAQVEGYATQLQVALSMLSKEVKSMRLDEFVARFCPDRQFIRDPDSNIIELRQKPQDPILPDCPRVATSFEVNTHIHSPVLQNSVQPTPSGFPSTVRDVSLQMADKIAQDKPEDEEFLRFMESFRSSRFCHSNVTTPAENDHSMLGVTPKTMRVPKKGEALLSVNGSPLGIVEENVIQAIPDEQPRRARRRLRASVMPSND